MTAPDTETLLPCPFCGGAEIDWGVNEWNDVFHYCKDCLAQGPIKDVSFSNFSPCPELWNTRAPSPDAALIAERDALVEAAQCCRKWMNEDAWAADFGDGIDRRDAMQALDAALAATTGGRT